MLKKNNLRDVREGRGISQLKLSQLTGIAPGTICNIENHKIYVYEGWRKRLSEALDMPEANLFPEYQNNKEVK